MKKKRENVWFQQAVLIERTVKHHLIEWGAVLCTIAGAILNSLKHVEGFYIWAVANFLWMSFAWKYKHGGLFVMNLVLLLINLNGLRVWLWG